MRRCIFIALALIILLGLLLLPRMAAAQEEEKQYYYGQIAVDLYIRQNGDVDVTERIQFVYTRGTFRSAFRAVDLSRVESIGNVTISEGGVAYRPVSSETTNGFSAVRSGNMLRITWWYPPTFNAARTFTLSYTAKGALRIYDGGDQLWWKAIWADRGQRVLQTTTTVHLPAGIDPAQLKIGSYGGRATYTQPNASTVVFTTGALADGEELEVRVQFPHGIVQAPVPLWQQADDEARRREEELAPFKALATLVSFGLMLFIPVAGGVGIYSLWYNKGRDKPVGLVADYLATPPSDLPAGIVGTLIDEQADLKDIIATVVDLARRGVITITEEEKRNFFGMANRDFIYTLVKRNANLRPHERALISAMFGKNGTSVRLSALRDKFYVHVPTLKEHLYQAVVTEGFFRQRPDQTRTNWLILGVLILVVAFVAFIVGLGLTSFTPAAVLPSIGIGIVGIMMMIVATAMPRRTDKGAEAAARWKAFSRYLANIEKYTDLKQAKDIFDKYLPYAIAFGLERSWVRKFAVVDAPAPTWWGPYSWGPRPTYEQGPRPVAQAGGGPVTDVTGGAPVGGGGLPSLQGASDSMMGGLQSMSDGLMSMLNSAGSVFTSQPSSSGGGGGWSGGGGGGGFGGGGGGGGSSGAR